MCREPELQRPQVPGFIELVDREFAIGECQLIDAAWVLAQEPIARQGQGQCMHQDDAVHAVMPHQHDGLVWMGLGDVMQGIGGTPSPPNAKPK